MLPNDTNGRPVDWIAGPLLSAVRGLRGSLTIDEDAFRKHTFHAAPRDFVLWTALDEAEKSAMVLMRLAEFLGDGKGKPLIAATDSFARTAMSMMIEEAHLRVRRLCELLVELVLFKNTDEEDYYRHFLLLRDFVAKCGFNADLRDFHGAESGWIAASTTLTFQEIQQLEARIDFGRAWYASYQPPLKPQKWKGLLSTARDRIKGALPLTTDHERLALGTTYLEAFGHPSESIHYAAGVDRSPSEDDDLESEGTKIAFLAVFVVMRCRELLGNPDEPASAQMARVFEANPEGSRYLTLLNQNPGTAVGDFVLARGYLGEVVEEHTSAFGYRSFRVDFLAERPWPDLVGDWFRARDVTLLFARQKSLKGIADYLGDKKHLLEPADLREGVRAAWQAGLGEQVRRLLRQRRR